MGGVESVKQSLDLHASMEHTQQIIFNWVPTKGDRLLIFLHDYMKIICITTLKKIPRKLKKNFCKDASIFMILFFLVGKRPSWR